MNKSELIKEIAMINDLNVDEAGVIIDLILNTIKGSLLEGQRVEIRGFGSFCIREYEGYVGRNPKTGIYIDVKAKRIPFFRPAKEMKKQINM